MFLTQNKYIDRKQSDNCRLMHRDYNKKKYISWFVAILAHLEQCGTILTLSERWGHCSHLNTNKRATVSVYCGISMTGRLLA